MHRNQKHILFLVLSCVFSLLIFSIWNLEATPALAQSTPIYIQYHLWYTYDDEQLPGYEAQPPNYGRWHGWSQTTKSFEVQGGVPPTNFRSPWRRITASRLGLPLLGPYSSGAAPGTNSAEAIRYHFTLAKRAGIDSLFASMYDGRWQDIFRRHLDIAQEIGVQIGLEIYYGTGSIDSQKPLLLYYLRTFGPHPAYLKIDGKPVIWIANYPLGDVFRWGNKNQMQQILSEVEREAGPFYVVMTGPTTDSQGARFSDIPQILKIVTVENLGIFWNRFGQTQQISPQLTGSHQQDYERDYQNAIDIARAKAGGKLALHVYPGFDERGLFPTGQDRQSGSTLPRTVIGRDGNGMYAANDGFLKAALDKAKANNLWVFLESWNDWNEQTQIEPGFHFDQFAKHRDYFSPLRRVAEFKGRNAVTFPYPSAEILDPPLKQYCRHKEWGEASGNPTTTDRVSLKGKLGFGYGANSCTNGIAFRVSFLDTDGVWKIHGTWSKAYNGQLMDLDINLTQIREKPITIGIESLGSPNCDWSYLPELKLDWNGQEIDLLQDNRLSRFNWNTQIGSIPWGNDNPSGTAILRQNVSLENGQIYTRSLYLHPDWNYNGFVHAKLELRDIIPTIPTIPATNRVELKGKIGLGYGANACTNGVAFMVSYLDDDRSYQDPSYNPATRFVNHALIEKKYNNQVASFHVDLTPLLDKPGIVWGIESLGSPNCDWTYLPELKLDWYGQEINLLNSNILGHFHWQSGLGEINWGNDNPSGSANLRSNARLEDNQTYPTALYLHPNWNTGGFIHVGLDFWAIAPFITPCP